MEIAIGGIVFLLLLSQIFKLVGYLQKKRVICAHGVQGGDTLRLCPKCIEIARQQLEEQNRKRRIETETKELQKKEIERLNRVHLEKYETLLALSPQKFEDAVANLFRKLGYQVIQTPYTNDRGRDAIATDIDDKRYVIECKRYEKEKGIGRPYLQKFESSMREAKAQGGYFVTTGHFTWTAEQYASENNITLIDGDQLCSLMRRSFPDSQKPEFADVMCLLCGQIIRCELEDGPVEWFCPNHHIVRNELTVKTFLVEPGREKVFCTCGRPMRVVYGKNGRFWGCTAYPNCRQTRQYSGW